MTRCLLTPSQVYLTGITVLGAAAVAMSLLEVFQQTHWRSTRAALYVGLGCMGVVPLGHMLILHGDVWHVRTFVLRDLFMGISYIVSGNGTCRDTRIQPRASTQDTYQRQGHSPIQ